jgi:hypothetical protein
MLFSFIPLIERISLGGVRIQRKYEIDKPDFAEFEEALSQQGGVGMAAGKVLILARKPRMVQSNPPIKRVVAPKRRPQL